ncbi:MULTISPECIES: AlpA family transcriptional regulator [Photobacterium]|uniref:Prophage CP4-57 regulatory protein (AlpA) n=1 Tax=Photobacterium aquimaris TaxID=512643 RepID=A0A1Y6L4D6_9GAMM|nr:MULTISPECIES: AlpA family transcriptional regulator [Photobacterium]OBU32968.1 AlpA family transcriptional regulator [Photobacterium kishitanii]PSW48040.1 AlpA family phage regulatory protein [Photobacterium kishitanii]SMY18205.1 Prophage CP4-57 regulatory protein (AlpA) [Photobacterium aquimaris]
MFKKIIRLPEVKIKTGLSRSSIYLRMSKGEFPQKISLGNRAVGWVNIDVDQWLEDCIASSMADSYE